LQRGRRPDVPVLGRIGRQGQSAEGEADLHQDRSESQNRRRALQDAGGLAGEEADQSTRGQARPRKETARSDSASACKRKVNMKTLLVALAHASAPAYAQDFPLASDALGNLEARPIGPAAMSGRVAAIDALQGDKLMIWVGAASGGAWKSVDGGIT